MKNNKEKLLARLTELEKSKQSSEDKHVQADDALLAFIGDPEISTAFDLIEKYYA